jgi:hypothetical protein
VVGAGDLVVDVRLRILQAVGGEAVIETPADVPGTDAGAIRPPAVTLRERRVLGAEGIREAVVVQQLAEGLAFLVREAGVAAVRGGISQVDLGVRDVEVAADDDGLLLREAGEVLAEVGVPLETVVEALERCEFGT